MNKHAEHLSRVAAGWDGAADGYDAYFVPRFAPWLADAVDAVTWASLPDGPITVPCCGTFPELDSLYSPGRDIVGIDLSPGMVRRARERAAGRATVVVGDASTLEPRHSAAVLSVFGLQQLPNPEAAIASWAGALVPGGMLSVVYWPGVVEQDGPFALMRQVLQTGTEYSWENRIVAAITATGAVVERDELARHAMTHENATAMIDAYIHDGPLRALANARGEEFVAGLRAEFLRRAPAGVWTHYPTARLIVARLAS